MKSGINEREGGERVKGRRGSTAAADWLVERVRERVRAREISEGARKRRISNAGTDAAMTFPRGRRATSFSSPLDGSQIFKQPPPSLETRKLGIV